MIRLSNAQAKSISKDAIQNLLPEPSFVLWACMSEASYIYCFSTVIGITGPNNFGLVASNKHCAVPLHEQVVTKLFFASLLSRPHPM